MTELPNSATESNTNLSLLLIALLKGVLYRDSNERQWESLLNLQHRVRDYMMQLNLELILDEAEGYAFLKSRSESDTEESNSNLPRLIARRPLSFPVSLLLALLRKKLAEFDASGSDTRLILTREQIAELIRIFLPASHNEARLLDQIETHINKVVELGFLGKLKPPAGMTQIPASYEVRRILKAFVDAQWLADLDAQLAIYQAHISGTEQPTTEVENE
ncbi:MAG: DUF4194 domain-containing protein [Enterobacteriaceae bacterium]